MRGGTPSVFPSGGTSWFRSIEFVADFSDIGSGFGGYNQDHVFFGYRQSL